MQKEILLFLKSNANELSIWPSPQSEGAQEYINHLPPLLQSVSTKPVLYMNPGIPSLWN